METKELIDLGLTKHQAEVYLELIKNPEQTGGKLAKKLSLDRSFTYGILNNLMDKGLVSYITKESKRFFQSADPDNLLKEIEEKRIKTLKLVKELKLIKEKKKDELSVNIYEGKSGFKIYARDILESNEFSTLGGGGKLNFLEILKYDYPHYLKEFKNKKIKGKIITSNANLGSIKNMFKNAKVEVKTLDKLNSQINFTAFKDKIAIYSAEEKPFVIIIESKKVADSLKNHFDNYWKSIKTQQKPYKSKPLRKKGGDQ
ncbi:MAG: hypothetical protein KKH88_03005 [Nanoarchaeota archaeon]|nr:hypothetical protein [Nanoarchaeota archaeon]